MANSSSPSTPSLSLPTPTNRHTREIQIAGVNEGVVRMQQLISNNAAKLAKLSPEQLAAIQAKLTPRMTKFSPHVPTATQNAFLLLDGREGLFGGSCGGGKSDALLMAALQYIDIPGYAAIIFRQSYSDLALPGALMERSAEWLQPYVATKEVRWNDKDKTYTFKCPRGGTSTLTFGYMEIDKHKYRYQSSAYQFVGFDELTQMLESCYRYMFSRLRRLKGVRIPVRVRSATNPGGDGHEWVKRRFGLSGFGEQDSAMIAKGKIFIPSRLEDNPYLDREEYEKSLDELDVITKLQLRSGNWDAKTDTSIFDRRDFGDPIDLQDVPRHAKVVRFWDCAATDPENTKRNAKKGKDPDWTTGCKLAEANGIYYVMDMKRLRKKPADVENTIQLVADLDGYDIHIGMEQEPGSSGIALVSHFARNVLKGYAFEGIPSTGSKALRAVPASTAASQGRVKIVRGSWNDEFFDELEAFPNGEHDDQVDAFSGSFKMIREKPNLSDSPLDVMKGQASHWIPTILPGSQLAAIGSYGGWAERMLYQHEHGLGLDGIDGGGSYWTAIG